MAEQLMTVTDYAKFEGVSPEAVYKAVHEGRVDSVKLGKMILVKPKMKGSKMVKQMKLKG